MAGCGRGSGARWFEERVGESPFDPMLVAAERPTKAVDELDKRLGRRDQPDRVNRITTGAVESEQVGVAKRVDKSCGVLESVPLTGRPKRGSSGVRCSGLRGDSECPAGRCHDVTDDSSEGVDTFSAAVRSERVSCP